MIFKEVKTSKFVSVYFLMLMTLVLSIMSTSCSKFFKGKPKTAETIEFKSSDLNCLKELGKMVQLASENQLLPQHIDAGSDCLAQTISLFQEKIEGRKSAHTLTVEDVSLLIQKFYPEAKLSTEAYEQIFLLKKAILGGTEFELTKVEMSQLKSLIILLKEDLKKLVPYLKIMSFKKTETEFLKSEFIAEGLKLFKELVFNFFKSSNWMKSGYRLTDFKNFLESLNLINDMHDKKLIIIEKVIVFLWGQEPLKNQDEYFLATQNLIDLAELYAQTQLTDFEFSIADQKNFIKMTSFAEKILLSLESTLQFKRYKILTVESIDALIISILDSNLLNLNFKKETLLDFYKTVLIRIFSDQRNISAFNFKGIESIHIKNLKREFYIFKIFSEFIESINFDESLKISTQVVQNQLKHFKLDLSIQKNMLGMKDNIQLIEDIKRGLQEHISETLSERPIVFKNKRLVIAHNQNLVKMTRLDLVQVLFGKTLGRGMMLGWGEVNPQLDLTQSYILEAGFVRWYADFKNFGIETKLFEPVTLNAGADNFTKANLFTLSGNGDDRITLQEISQYINMILSGGASTTKKLKKDLQAQGCALNELDIYQETFFDEKCFLGWVKSHYSLYFSNMYNYVYYLKSLTKTQFDEFFIDLREVSFDQLSSQKGKMGTDDTRGVIMTSMFIESLVAAYDKSPPFGELDRVELSAAYKRFRSVIIQKAQEKGALKAWNFVLNPCKYVHSEEDLFLQTFQFLAIYGRTPEEDDFQAIKCIRGDIFNLENRANRMSILKTLKFLKSDASSSDASEN